MATPKRLSPLSKGLVLACAALLLATGSALAAPPAPNVKVLDAGKGRKVALRYTPTAGTVQQVRMVVAMETEMHIGANQGQKQGLPDMEMDMDIRVTKVADGKITYVFDYNGMRVRPKPGADVKVAGALEAALTPLVGVKGSTTITDRGEVLEMRIDVPDSAPAPVKQTIETLRKSMRQLSFQLPREPVGQGARWIVVSRVAEGPMTLTQTTNVTLLSPPSDTLDLALSISQEAPRQKLKHANMPPGANLELLSLSGAGKGAVKQELGKIVPLKSTTGVKTEIVMQTQAKGMPGMQMRMDTQLDVTLGPRK